MDELAAECTAIEAFQYCGPNIIFASGSPFRDVDLGQISLNLILSIPYKVHLMFLVNSARICLTWLAWRMSIGPLAVPHHRSGSILGLSLLDDSERVDLEYPSPTPHPRPCLFESERFLWWNPGNGKIGHSNQGNNMYFFPGYSLLPILQSLSHHIELNGCQSEGLKLWHQLFILAISKLQDLGHRPFPLRGMVSEIRFAMHGELTILDVQIM
jgi:hypothetical protein